MLKIRSLTKTYSNGYRALRAVNLDVPTGVLGLLGPNGAGKSTLMRTIATLQGPDSGTITLDGWDVLANPERAKAAIGYLPQEFGLYARVSARTMLEHLAVLKGVVERGARRELVDGLLARVNLWNVRDQWLQGFSGGMRQRLGIAQALIGKPRLIIVDEPTAGLDPVERNRILDLLAEAGDTSLVILSTHLVDDVQDLCPRMAILVAGEIRLTSTPSEAIQSLTGCLWQFPKAKGAHDDGTISPIICTRRREGTIVAYTVSETKPSATSTLAQPDLEHVFFDVVQGAAADHSSVAA